MNVQEYLEEMKKIQNSIIDFIDNEDNIEENFHNINIVCEDQKIFDDQNKFKSLLHLILKIANNHHREPNFYSKIDRIMHFFQKDIKNFFSNSEIFHIFKGNKRILLFLIEEKIMIVDKYVISKIISTDKYIEAKYPQYFSIEFKAFQNEKWFPKIKKKPYYDYYDDSDEQKEAWLSDIMKELPENFNELRKTGENHNLICNYIRKDMIKEFIIYVNKNNISLNSGIDPSIYETNSFLIKKQREFQNKKPTYSFFFINNNNNNVKNDKISLIEYAAFFGSNQVFNYLYKNGAEMMPSLWKYAIHGQNAEIIHTLEENHVDIVDFERRQQFNRYDDIPKDEAYNECLNESIKCHHNDLFMYIQNNYLQNDTLNSPITYVQSIKSYNFALVPYIFINEFSLFFLCQYDYFNLVQILLKEKNIDINQKFILLIVFFKWNSKSIIST